MKKTKTKVPLGSRLICKAAFLLVTLFSFSQLNAQTLKTDSKVPVLDACSGYQQFSMSIVKGNQNCVQGKLKIEIPDGFEFQNQSVKLDGVPEQVNVLSSQAIEVPVKFKTGANTEEVKVTFSVKALCEVIGKGSTVSVVNYTFIGCNDNVTGTSEPINIRYAVLRASVTPNNIVRNVNDEIDRKIEIINQGNGSIFEFTLERTLGNGLADQASVYDVSNAISNGWVVDFSNPNVIKFSGKELKTGEKVYIIEKIKIVDCDLTPTLYEVYYGCSTKCTTNNVSHNVTNVVNVFSVVPPKFEVEAIKPNVLCFNTFVKNTWKVKNIGGVTAKGIVYQIKSDNDIKITNGAIKVNGIPVNVLEGSTSKNAIISLSDINAGQTVTIEFEEFYNAPNGPSSSCLTAPEFFNTSESSYSAVFTYDGACKEIEASKAVNESVTYKYAGQHVGEVDIYNSTPFNIQYLFHDFSIPHAHLNEGDQFVITIDLSAGLIVNDVDYKGIKGVNVGGNKYEVTITYGSPAWKLNKDFSDAFSRLFLEVNLDCKVANLDDLWYTVGGEIRKQDTSCNAVVFKCNKTKFYGFCGSGPCPDGLLNGPAELKRTNIGLAVDNNKKPILGSTSSNAELRHFIEGDLLEISQVSTVNITSVNFTKIKFEVKKSEVDVNVDFVPNSGKLYVDGNLVNGAIQVYENGDFYEFVYNLQTPLQNEQKVKLALTVKATESNLGLKRFPVQSYLINDEDVEIKCGDSYSATGLYLPTKFNFNGENKDFVECSIDSYKATFEAKIVDFSYQDSFFSKEYRSIFNPNSVSIKVPANLIMTGVKFVINGQDWLGQNNSTSITGLNVSNSEYQIDLANIIKAITSQVLGSNNGLTYLDEGWKLEIYPTVTLNACEPVLDINNSVENLEIDFKGTVVDGKSPATNFNEIDAIEYGTGIGTLSIKTSSGDSHGFFTPDGREVYWVTEIQSEGSRNFNSVWLAKKSGELNIKSIQEVSDLSGDNIINTVSPINEIYRLGNFKSGVRRYFLIKANVNICEVEQLVLTAGYNCETATYPLSINDATCKINDVLLDHTQIRDVIQTEIIEQFNNADDTKPNLCNDIWYTIQLHNGGDSKLDNLVVKIPLNSALGLGFEKFEIGTVYKASEETTINYISAGTSTIVNDILTITLPSEISINTLEQIRVRVHFKVNSCDFRSGSKHTITSTGLNICGGEVNNATDPSTKRILIDGGSDAFPELRLVEDSSKLIMDPVLSNASVLRATYSIGVLNSGEFNVNDAITSDYNVALKLPNGWSVVGDPSTYLLPTNKVSYQSYDPARGYVFNVTSDINVGEVLNFDNLPLKYTLTNEKNLDCAHDFGSVQIIIYQNIAVDLCLPGVNCQLSGIDQVLFEEFSPMVLPTEAMLTIEPANQTIKVCNPTASGNVATLADVVLAASTNVFHLDWYENEQEALADLASTRLPITTPLVDGRTYYVINRFVYDGVCKSNIGAIKVTLAKNNLSGTVTTKCNDANGTYQVKVVLNGKAPYTVTGTGAPGSFDGNVWTSNPITAGNFVPGESYNITFTDSKNCNPFIVSGSAPVCCTLEISAPAEKTVNCGSSLDASITGLPTISKSCGLTNVSYQDSVMSSCNAGFKSFTRTFTVSDAGGNVKKVTQLIKVKDDVKPIFNGNLPSNLTVSCASLVPSIPNLSASDNCGTATITFNESKTDETCTNNFVITRTWVATDLCGNSTTHVQTITVKDDVKPKFVGALPLDVTVSCASLVPNVANLTATDNCGTVSVTTADEIIKAEESCANNYTIKRTYKATDSCGNSTSHVQIITVNDTIKPQFVENLPGDITVSCSSEIPAAVTLTATDNCGEAPVTLSQVKVDGSCAGNFKWVRTWTATDGCGNKITHTQNVFVEDKTAPKFEINPANKVVECDGQGNLEEFHAWLNNYAGAVAVDNCSTVKMTYYIEDTNTICGFTGDIIVSFIATDSCGNSTIKQAVFFIKDTVAPVFSQQAKPITIECGTNQDALNAWLATNGGAIASDTCSADVTWTNNFTQVIKQCGNSGYADVTFKATDACGNSSTSVARVTIADTKAPVLMHHATNLTVNCNSNTQTAIDNWLNINGGAIAIDSCSEVTWTNNYDSSVVICGSNSSTEVTFTATDACGKSVSTKAILVLRAVKIVANDDNLGPINGLTGGETQASVLNNDIFNRNNVNPADVILTPGQSSSSNVVMNPDGTITVEPNTPAGEYTIPYTICDKLYPTNCESAEVIVVVNPAPIVGTNDNFEVLNGYEGGTNPTSVLVNDKLNGVDIIPSQITLTPGVASHPNIIMDGNGIITVLPNTPSGEHTIEYTICEILNPTNCDTATVTVVVAIHPIVAGDDNTFNSINGYVGGTTPSVLDNDTLNGAEVIPTEVTLTPGLSSNPGVVMNPDGTITVSPSTPAGTYTIEYTICEILNPTNCDSATATVVVEAAEIVAEDDNTFNPINGYVGGTTPSVLDNDTLNGGEVIPTEVTLTPGVSSNPGVVMNTDGTITVSPSTPAGTYTIEYTICEILNPTNCDSATATVVVEAAEIVAEEDTFNPINGYVGGTTPSVLDNDTLNGAEVIPTEVTLTPGVSSNPGVVMNPDGTITVSPSTPAGTYTIEYTICEILNPTNCDSATATVVVEAAEIVAEEDTFNPINGYVGGTTPSVLDNDTLNGAEVIPTEVTLTPGVSSNPGVVMNPDGTITVSPSTPAGTYTIEYTICEILNPTNCDSATATVVVEAAEIVAEEDTFNPINGYVGGTTPSVLDNDTLNGAEVIPTEVTLTPGVSSNPGVVMNPDGTITVSPSTPAGTYTIEYTICEILNPTNCDSATSTVVVEAILVEASNDVYGPLDGLVGAVTESIFNNDSVSIIIGGETVSTIEINTSQIELVPGVSPVQGMTMNSDGSIVISPSTPAGTYYYEYALCEILNPGNCATAVVEVIVELPIIDAVQNIYAPIDSKLGALTESVLNNDTINGGMASLQNVKMTPGQSPNAGILMNADGTIKVVPNTPAGAYIYPYTICDVVNPTNCASTQAIILIDRAPENILIDCSEKLPETQPVFAISQCEIIEITHTDTVVGESCSNSYSILRTWTAVDSCGNVRKVSQTITIQDTTAPVFVGNLPAENVYMNCKDLKPAEILQAVDTCGTVTVTSYDEEIPGDCDSKYTIVRTWVATDSCGNETSFVQNIHLSCAINVFNGVTPDGDGLNDELVIEGLNCYPGNTVEIYNRWGVLVYETKNYNSNGNTFKGYSEGRATVSRDSKLPTGTYFYIIKYAYDLGNGEVTPIEQSGYLHLETN